MDINIMFHYFYLVHYYQNSLSYLKTPEKWICLLLIGME